MANEKNMADNEKKQVGLVALFDQQDDLIKAASTVRDAGFVKWDCHTPFPVHGLDKAMGLKNSPIPTIALLCGFTGVGVALLMQWWMSAVDYPVRIGGKALFSWQAFMPVIFELFVLFAALSLTGSLIYFCKLWRWHSPLHDSDIMKEITCDKFAVVLDADDENYSADKSQKLLEGTGCGDIRPLYEFVEEDSSIFS